MKILVVKFGALGDIIRTSYILPGLYEKYKNLKVDWLTSETGVDLIRFNPYIFKIFTPKLNFNDLFEQEYDLVLSLDDEEKILQMIQKLRYKELFGAYINKNSNRTYTDNASLWFDMGLLSKYGKEEADRLKIANKLTHSEIFSKMLGISIQKPIFYNSNIIENYVFKKFRFDKKYFNLGINSGAGGRWKSKQLRIEETIKLIEKLLKTRVNNKEVKIYLLGGKDEKERHETLLDKYKKYKKRVIDTGNDNSLLEFAAIIKNLDYIITSDSLALHLAISQGIKNLSYYAPTSAQEIDTFGLGVKVISLSGDYCSYKSNADNSTITAERIFEAFTKHLGINP